MSGHSSHGAGHEHDLSFKTLLWMIPLSMLLLIAYVVTVWFGSTASLSREMARKQANGAEPLRQPLLTHLAKEEAILRGYGWADKEKKLARIPIEKAMGSLIRESAQPVNAAKPKAAPKAAAKAPGK